MVMFSVNKQGGTNDRDLYQEAMLIWNSVLSLNAFYPSNLYSWEAEGGGQVE